MANKRNNQYNNPFQATFKGISDLFKKHDRVGELSPSERLDGKNVLITGSSSGLGFASAEQLARLGATVIMACRSGIPEKGNLIRERTGSDQVFMHQVDLSEKDSIRRLVETLKQDYGKIDILVCNAAVVPKESRRTRDGLEEMFMVNYLAKFILVNMLVEEDCFNAASGAIPRIIIVSSESHRNPRAFRWEEFGVYKEYGMGKTVELYGYYKLLLTTFVNELSRRLNPGGQTRYSVFSLCPGPVNSNIAREAPGIFQPLLKLTFRLFFRSPEKAAEPVIYLAASKDLEGKTLDYLFLMSRKDMDEKAKDPENGLKLWDLSEKLIS